MCMSGFSLVVQKICLRTVQTGPPGPPVRRHSVRLHEAAKKAKAAKGGHRLVTYSARRVEPSRPSRPSRGPKLARAEIDEEEEDCDESDDVYPTKTAGSKNARSRKAKTAAKVATAKVSATVAASKRPFRSKPMAEPPTLLSRPSLRSALKRSTASVREAEALAGPPVQQDWGAWLTSNRVNVKMLQPQASQTREAATSRKRKAVADVDSPAPESKSKVQKLPASKQSKPSARKSDWWALPEVSVEKPEEELWPAGPRRAGPAETAQAEAPSALAGGLSFGGPQLSDFQLSAVFFAFQALAGRF
eukprot:s5197_g1.t1